MREVGFDFEFALPATPLHPVELDVLRHLRVRFLSILLDKTFANFVFSKGKLALRLHKRRLLF